MIPPANGRKTLRTIRQLPTPRALELFAAFFDDLARADLRPLTITGYGHDLHG